MACVSLARWGGETRQCLLAGRAGTTRDVKKLAEFGLVRVRQQNNPGHGIVQIVEPIAGKLVMRADIWPPAVPRGAA